MESKNMLKALTIVGLSLAAAAPAHAAPADCQTAQFTPAVVAKFPRIREVCLDIVTKDGQQYAVVKADLLRISSKVARLRPHLPDGTKAEPRDIAIDPARKVMINGEAVNPRDVAVGQEVQFLVKVNEPVAALEYADTAPVAPMPLPEQTAAAEPAPEMPTTAGPLPLIGLGGFALLALGGAIGLIRRRRMG